MAAHEDYVPVKDADFDVWFKNLVQYVNKKTTPQPPATIPAETLAKDEARPFVGQWLVWKQVSDAEREEMGLHNPKPRRPEIPSPSTVPELSPGAGHPRQIVIPYRDQGSARRGKPEDVHGIEVQWAAQNAAHFELGSLRRAQTPRIYVWSFALQNSQDESRLRLSSHPPASIKELDNFAFDTKSPLTLEFGEEDRGKKIYITGRWEIEREGVKGDFGEIVSAIVP
jgi:hypothetical protein